jgi:hypothetical protein
LAGDPPNTAEHKNRDQSHRGKSIREAVFPLLCFGGVVRAFYSHKANVSLAKLSAEARGRSDPRGFIHKHRRKNKRRINI